MCNISINIFTVPSDLNKDLDMLESFTWIQQGHSGGASCVQVRTCSVLA